MSVTIFKGAAAVTLTVEAAFNDKLFAASPSWTDITANLVSADLSSTSRTNELDQFQPGFANLTYQNRGRTFDPTYGPAATTFGGGFWSAGDLAAFAGATELDLRACVAPSDWTPGTAATISSQFDTTSNQRSWQFSINTSGYLSLATSTNGTAATTVTSGCRPASVDGQKLCVRVTWSSTAGAVKFYTKRTTTGRERADCLAHTGWTQIGATVTGVTAGLFNSTNAVIVGGRGTGAGTQLFAGDIFYADARTTIGSDTLRFAYWPADAASASATSWTASAGAGETWTKSGTSTLTLQGTYFGKLVPGVPLRVRVTHGGVDRTIWYGYVRRWPQAYPQYGLSATVRIEALDALGWLAEKVAPATPYGMGLAATWAATYDADPTTAEPDPYWPLHEAFPASSFAETQQGTAGGQYVGGAAGGPTQPGAGSTPTRSFPTLNDTAKALKGSLPYGAFTSYSPTLAFWVYIPTTISAFEVVAANGMLSFVQNSTGITLAQFDEPAISSFVIYLPRIAPGSHYVEISFVAANTASILIDGVVQNGQFSATGLLSRTGYPALYVSGWNIIGGCTISDVVVGRAFDSLTEGFYSGVGRPLEQSGSRMSWLLAAAGLPAGLISSHTDPTSYLGPQTGGGTFGSQAKEIEAAEAGRLFVAGNGVVTFRSRIWAATATAATVSQGTFGDNGTELPYMDISVDANNIDDIVNVASVSIASGTSGSARNQSSVTAFGERATSRSAPLTNGTEAVNLAAYLANVRPWPTTRTESLVITPLVPGKESSLWPQVLDRAIGERITVTRRPTDTLRPSVSTRATTVDVTIEGISHRFDAAGQSWVTSWVTAPAPPTADQAQIFTADHAVLGVVDAGNVASY